MANRQMILEYGLYISSPGWWQEGEYGLYISSPGWWHEDEFLLHLVGGMSGKLPNDIRGCTFHHLVCDMKQSTGCTFHHLVGGMNGKLPNDIRVRVVHFITWLVA
ncbi:hypothetical protein ACFX2J_017209 [Malus domestica]